MLKKLESFFINFKDSKISDESLSLKIGESLESIIDFFKDYNNYKDSEIMGNIHIKKEYFDQFGKLVRFNHFLDKTTNVNIHLTKITFIDRYFVSKKRELDLYFSEKLFNITPEKGQIDDSDCGGLYRSAWTYSTIDGASHESEIPFFHQENIIDILFKKIPWIKCSIHYYDNLFHITLSSSYLNHKYVSVEINDLSLGIMQATKGFLEQNKIKLFSLVPIENSLFDKINHNELFFKKPELKTLLNDNDESTWFTQDYSIPVFYSKEDSLKKLEELHKTQECKYVIVIGS